MKIPFITGFVAFFLLALSVSSCQTYSEEDKSSFDQKIQAYIKKSKVKYEKSESGLYYYIEQEGEGDFIKYKDEVSIIYEGRLLNGQVVDGAHTKEPLTYEVSKFIAAWKEALLYVKKGGKLKLIAPPHLGYGDNELEDIPKNSILVFDLEVLDVN